MVHPPLSQSLSKILEEKPPLGGITLNYLIERTERRGMFLVLILLSLTFITPVALPGLSNVLGTVIVFLSVRLAFRMPPYLPRFIGNRKLSPARMAKVLRASVRVLRWMEKWIKPRRTDWMTWPNAQFGNALLMALMSFLLALPIPPVVPLTNVLPGLTIILLAACMMEEDGYMIWAGYGMALLTLGYMGSVAGVAVHLFLKYSERIFEYLRNLF